MRVRVWATALLFVGLLLPPLTTAQAASNVLTWGDLPNETSFTIERKADACTGPLAFTPLATVGQNVTTFTDSAVQEGVTYCYRVSATNPAGTGPFSNAAGRSIPFSVPAAPSTLTVKGGP